MELTPYLVEQIRQAKTVVLLGAGASQTEKDKNGNSPPSAPKLATMLSTRFLGAKFPSLPLASVAELAISESDLPSVQNYIREIFESFEPSPAHKRLPHFMWAGLATTNYDRLIEKAYNNERGRLQSPQAFIENGDLGRWTKRSCAR